MKINVVNSLLVITIFFCASCKKEAQKVVISSAEPVEQQSTLIVTFDEQTSEALLSKISTKSGPVTKTGINNIDEAFSSLGVKSIERVFPDAGEWEVRHREAGLHKFYYVTYDTDSAVQTKAGEVLKGVSGISGAETAPKIKLLSETPKFNDPYLSRQWHYYNTGSGTRYKAGADINVVPVWNKYTTGSSNVIVSVVDGGVTTDHEDLGSVVIPGGSNGSWNFVDGTSNIVAHDHGTHVAGTIAAINNNGIGVCGVAGGEDGNGGVRILSSQVFRYDEAQKKDIGGNTSSAIVWGADHGAIISQNSWGYDFDTESAAKGSSISSSDKAAIDYFIKYAGTDKNGNQSGPMKGGVVIFAAGNDNWSIGWPCAYDKVIAVGAMSSQGNKSYYSNYGDWVDIAAPGGDAYVGPQVLSTVPSGYDEYQGTSMACPHVSGVAALIVSYFGGEGFTNDMLVERLLGGANAEFISNSKIGPLVDAYGSFTYGEKNVPEKVSRYTVVGRGGSLEFSWTVGGTEDGSPAYAYLLMASKNESDFTDINLARLPSTMRTTRVVVGDLSKGDDISAFMENLEFTSDYYVAIVGFDYNKNYGEISDVIPVSTTANNAPEIEEVTALPWQVMASGKKTFLLDITDPDNHVVNVTFSLDSKLKSATSGQNKDGYYYITVNGLEEEPGEYTVGVSAKDVYGAATNVEYTVTVLENRAPEALKDFDNLIFEKIGQKVTFNVADYFTDPDGDALTFVVEHTNSKVAHVNPLGSEITLTTLGYGNDVITIKAQDPRKAEISRSFKVSVRDPKAGADIYPTQVTDVLKISGGLEAETLIKIYSSTGALVYNTSVSTSAFNPAQIDMSGFAPGVYTVKVTINGIETVRSIVKL